MSKLKKIMGAGFVIIALFAALITVINQPTPALSQQPVPFYSGSTPPGKTAWQQAGVGGLYVDVDTSLAGYSRAVPAYITSLEGANFHGETIGATSIYLARPRSFRVYVRFVSGAPITPAFANQNEWRINWIAVPR
jgi:hypothetical protein